MPRRVVSINLCTDQLLLALADPAQIAGLGRFARHTEMSYLAARAKEFPTLRGSAEEVVRLHADLVLAGAFSGRATRQALTAAGVRVETFAPPRDLAEAKAEIVRAGSLLGQAERAEALLTEIGSALADVAAAARSRPSESAIALQRRGFASGPNTLLSAVMEAAGLRNAASTLGIGSVARAPLEAIVKLAPDVVIVEDLARIADQSTAVLRHPAIAGTHSRSRLIALPVAELTCGGPSLAPLIRRLGSRLAEAR